MKSFPVSTSCVRGVKGPSSPQESALEALTDIMLRYMTDMGLAIHKYAELAGRTEVNLNDVLVAFEEKDVEIFGTRGLQRYVESFEGEMTPFAQPVPSFPVRKKARTAPTFEDKQEEPPRHIPGECQRRPVSYTA